MNYFVHPTAIIEKNVTIGENVHVWHHCHVRECAIIGENVSLGKDVFIDKNVSIGKGSRIQNGVSIYNGVTIGDWVFVGPNVTFTNDRHPRAGTKNWNLSQTKLKDGCSIGAGTTIVSDVSIGAFSIIGAGSVLTENIPAFHLAYGLPAKIVSKICACGDKRLDLSTEPINYIQRCCPVKLNDEVIKLAKNIIETLK
jgi:acetyltransferase-like isoleucine patch superfamily enzyme